MSTCRMESRNPHTFAGGHVEFLHDFRVVDTVPVGTIHVLLPLSDGTTAHRLYELRVRLPFFGQYREEIPILLFQARNYAPRQTSVYVFHEQEHTHPC